jgi:hypothetical protein
MVADFQYDVFLSYSTANRAKVRDLAVQLRADGVDVWLDEWVIEPGDNIILKIEAGLESSRALVLCMSAAALGSDWVSLERTTALFRDPSNRRRRFVPLLLEDCEVPDVLCVYSRIDWRTNDPDEYRKLLKALRRAPADTQPSDGSALPPKPSFDQDTERNATRTVMRKTPMANNLSHVTFIAFPEPGPADHLLLMEELLAVSNWGNQSVMFIEPEPKKLLQSVLMDSYEQSFVGTSQEMRPVRRYPPGHMTAAKGKLFVSQIFSEFVCVIDVRSAAIVKRIPIGGEGSLVTSPDGQYVFFASNKKNEFYIVNVDSYEYRTVAFPRGGRGCLSCCVLRKGLLYLGIQRGGPGCFLAVFDLAREEYVATIRLADPTLGDMDSSGPICMLPSTDERFIYVGMFQSQKGIYVIDTAQQIAASNIAFHPNDQNRHFKWADPLALAWYRERLVSVNRNNYELAILDPVAPHRIVTVPLGGSGNGPQDVVIVGDEAFVSHKEMDGLLIVDLPRAIADNSANQHRKPETA